MRESKLKYVKCRIDTIVHENKGKFRREIYEIKEKASEDIQAEVLLGLANTAIPGKKYLAHNFMNIFIDTTRNEVQVPACVLKFSDVCNKGLLDKINKIQKKVNDRIRVLQSVIFRTRAKGIVFYDKVVLGNIDLTVMQELANFEQDIKSVVSETLD